MRIHEKRKEIWIEQLSVGQLYEGVICGVKNIYAIEELWKCIIFDKSGELEAELPKSKMDGILADGIYVMSFTVIMKKGHKTGLIKEILAVEKCSAVFHPMDIYSGISVEKRDYLQKLVMIAVSYVEEEEQKSNEGNFSKLLRLYFTEEEFHLLSIRPASVNRACRYAGGALVLLVNLTYMAKDVALEYRRLSSGLYGEKMDYMLLITACLLSMSGIRDYVTDNMNKSPKGFARGYYSLVQSRLEPLAAEAGLTELETDILLNTLHCMLPGVGKIKSVTLESSICRAVFALFMEMDEICTYLAESPSEAEIESGYRYCEQLQRPLLVYHKKEKGEKEHVGVS